MVHDVDRGGVDREVDAEALAAALGQQRDQQLAIIVLGDVLLDEAHAVLLRQIAVFMRVDDDETLLVIVEVPFDQRQRALADRAEADHDNRTGDLRVDLRAHECSPGTDGRRQAGFQLRRFAVTSISTLISGFRRAETTNSVAAGRISPKTSPQTANRASKSLASVK